MFRRLAALLLMLSVLSHSFAMAGQVTLASLGIGDSASSAAAHLMMHWDGEAHHHDDHGHEDDLHADDSSASAAHLVLSDGIQILAVITPDFSLDSLPAPQRPVVLPVLKPPLPDIVHLLRPPRAHS